MRYVSQFPKWIIEHERADDGMPYVTAKQRLTGAILGAHHGPDGWAVLNERWQVVTRSPDLRTGA